jgi:hypothetical protein
MMAAVNPQTASPGAMRNFFERQLIGRDGSVGRVCKKIQQSKKLIEGAVEPKLYEYQQRDNRSSKSLITTFTRLNFIR